MTGDVETTTRDQRDLPSLKQLGNDLLTTSGIQRWRIIAAPFVATAGYVLFAWWGWWTFAVASIMALSFLTYGSTSHDLVHRTLGLSRRWNYRWLRLIELLSLRSGTAYRLTHLNHHRHLLDESDIEGAMANATWYRSILEGFIAQPKCWIWAWRHYPAQRPALLAEAIGIEVLILAAMIAARWTPIPLIYVALVIAGSWVFPLVTVYFPHDRHGRDALTQTRLFRGWLIQTISASHLYHLEHHLYPAVPHHHWKQLAKRLDPYFQRLGLTAHHWNSL